MIFSLPQDVNEIIYDFLLFSKIHKKYFCISIKTTMNINESQSIKKYNLFYERINMAKEDKNENVKHIREDEKIFNMWNQYNLHKWYNKTNIKRLWKRGDYVDVYDFVRGWCPGIIMDAYIEKKSNISDKNLTIEYIRYYEVKFLGWADQFIEQVEINKIAPLGKYTVNPLKIYDSISRDCSNNTYYWALCKNNEKQWNMCKIIERIIEYDCIKLLSYNGDVYKISKNNIKNTIRHITDATTFFSIKTEYCFFKRRLFEI